MAATKTHDPNQILATFAGRSLFTGRAEGEFLTTEFLHELYTLKVGADGEVTRVKSANRAGKIVVKCMQTSDTHKLLTQLYAVSQASVNGGDIGAFEVRDLNGGLLEHAEQAWISKAPTNSQGADASEREWEISCTELVREVDE